MGVKGEIHFVKVAGGRLLQGPVMVRSRLWDGEIEIVSIPDYCAYLRVMSWVDVFDVGDTAAVRIRYEEERARGGMRYQACGGYRKRQLKILMSRFGWGCALRDSTDEERRVARHTGRNRELPLQGGKALTNFFSLNGFRKLEGLVGPSCVNRPPIFR